MEYSESQGISPNKYCYKDYILIKKHLHLGSIAKVLGLVDEVLGVW